VTTKPAANARRRTVVDYGPDPADAHARGLFLDTVERVQGLLVPAVVGANGSPETSFLGTLTRAVQNFAGAGNPGATTVVYRNGGNATIHDAIVDGPQGDPARAVFAARLRRGKPVNA